MLQGTASHTLWRGGRAGVVVWGGHRSLVGLMNANSSEKAARFDMLKGARNCSHGKHMDFETRGERWAARYRHSTMTHDDS